MSTGSSRRIVIKVGTTSLTREGGPLDTDYVHDLAQQVCALRTEGWSPILVSSGAISAGMGRLGLAGRPRSIPQKQAAAAVGQGLLMQIYNHAFARCGAAVAQMLLTRDDIRDRTRFVNARNTMNALMRFNVIPIINENDTIAVDEIRVGDNDTLAALVALLADADRLIILSDVDGLYDKNPMQHRDARLIPVIDEVDKNVEALAGGAGSLRGTGGMKTKINAAKICSRSGVTMTIANGRTPDVISRAVLGEVGTRFAPHLDQTLRPRQQWMAFGSTSAGTVIVNEGAKLQLQTGGKSLLPAGVTGMEGHFEPGDLITVRDETGLPIARGVVNYSNEALNVIKGQHTSAIVGLLGVKGPDEVVHRDNLVLS